MFQNRIKPKPARDVREYLLSKQAMELQRTSWDPLDSPRITLEREHESLIETEKYLEDKREEFRTKRKEFDELWKKLADDERELKENFTKFNRFVRENYIKRVRAAGTLEEQMKIRLSREKDVLDIKRRIEELKESKKTMEVQVRQHMIYEDFLNRVAEEGGATLKTSTDILGTYEAYAESRTILGEKQEDTLKKLEDARSDMARLTERWKLKMVGLHNRISELQSRFEDASSRTRRWENIVVQIKEYIGNTLGDVETIKMSTWNTYRKMCHRQNSEPTLHVEELESQFLFIKNTLKQLRKINVMLEKQQTAGKGSKHRKMKQ